MAYPELGEQGLHVALVRQQGQGDQPAALRFRHVEPGFFGLPDPAPELVRRLLRILRFVRLGRASVGFGLRRWAPCLGRSQALG